MTKTKSTGRRGAQPQVHEIDFNGKSVNINVPDIKQALYAKLDSIRQATAADTTWKWMAQQIDGKSVTAAFLVGLAEGKGCLKVDRFDAITKAFGITRATIIGPKGAGNNVTSLFPPSSVVETTEDEPVDWRKIFAKLLSTGCVDRDEAVEHWETELLNGTPVPYRELALKAIVDLTDGEVSLGQVWREPPLALFAKRISGEDLLAIQDILQQHAAMAETG